MRAFIAKGSDTFISKEIISENTYAAFYGFALMGWEIEFFENMPPKDLSRNDIVVGYISQVKYAWRNLGITPPDELDYPEELQSYLGRNVWKSTLHKIYTDESTWPVFVKPVKGKQFTGKLITGLGDMIGIGAQDDRDVWCSDPVNFISEWRGFVKYGQLIDCKCYKGDFKVSPNYFTVMSAISDYKSQPAAFTIDVGVVEDNGGKHTLIVEVNDGYAMGGYGLSALNYAKMISARWSEVVGIPDPCQF